MPRRSEPTPLSRRGRLPDLDPSAAARSYRDARARETIERARLARVHQDSTLTSYDATVKQRLSAGLNVKAIGRDRLLFRSELAARVRWNQTNRVWVDVLGARTAVPVSFPGAKVLTGVAELVHALEQDPALATNVLRFANSAANPVRMPIRTVRQAVSMVGRTGVRRLALDSVAYRFFERALARDVSLRFRVYTHLARPARATTGRRR